MGVCVLLVFLFTGGVNAGAKSRVAEETVDLIELNHFHDPCGRHVYDQVIFYQIAPETGQFRVRAWCLVEDRESLSRRPKVDPSTGVARVEWWDDQQQILRRLKSPQFRESWTQIDPERQDKTKWDERTRLTLVQCPKRAEADRQLRQRERIASESEAHNTPAHTSTEPSLSHAQSSLAGSPR